MNHVMALCSQICLLSDLLGAAQSAAFCFRNMLMVSHKGKASTIVKHAAHDMLKKPTSMMLALSVHGSCILFTFHEIAG